MTLDTFFDIVSPSTLASLVADVQAAGTGAPADALALERRAQTALVALVGLTEAARLVELACHAGDLVDLSLDRDEFGPPCDCHPVLDGDGRVSHHADCCGAKDWFADTAGAPVGVGRG